MYVRIYNKEIGNLYINPQELFSGKEVRVYSTGKIYSILKAVSLLRFYS